MLSVNLRGHFIAMQAQIPLMLATSPSPAIVLTSSICGHQAHAGMAGYCASKFGVRGLVKAAAVEYGPRGLRVNSVSPGRWTGQGCIKATQTRGPTLAIDQKARWPKEFRYVRAAHMQLIAGNSKFATAAEVPAAV